MLHEKIGNKAFKEAVQAYLKKHQFKNVETGDFIREVEYASNQDLNPFIEVWLKSDLFPYQEVIACLKRSDFIQEYLEIECFGNSLKCSKYLSSSISDEAKIKIILGNPEIIKEKDFSNSLKVRQAIAKSLTSIPAELKNQYESLLNDNSYITQEVALYNLWVNFPENRMAYLEKLRGTQGFVNKNIRILWLVLALNTSDFEPELNQKYFEELSGYTNPVYNFETRMQAFQYLELMKACDSICQDNLLQATKHHNWRFSKFAKDMLNND